MGNGEGMIITNDLYGVEYVKRIVEKEWRYETIPLLVQRLWEAFGPRSVIDFGCANGLHMKHFMEKGVEVMGIEGAAAFANEIQKNAWYADYLIQDIREPFNMGKKYDLAICIEVLEHLEEKYAKIAVENICNHANQFFITASDIPKGKVHINAKPKKYWIDMFESITRIKYLHEETLNMQSIFADYGNAILNKNMQKNIMVFCDLNVYPELKCEGKFDTSRPADIYGTKGAAYTVDVGRRK